MATIPIEETKPQGSQQANCGGGGGGGGDARGGAPVHNQVRRIREEEMRIGEAKGEGLSARETDRDRFVLLRLNPSVNSILCSRPMIRSSPLSSNAAVESPLR